MNDPHDDECRSMSGFFSDDGLEAELRLLSPLPLTDRTQQAIARDIEAAKGARVRLDIRRETRLRRVAMASVLAAAAACIAVAVSRIAPPSPPREITGKIVPVTKPAGIRVADPRQFAMAAYRRASAVSSDSLDALLDGQAAESPELSAEFEPRPVLNRGD